ncbi:hypothetical protein M422DRAFT_276242 [Sphaerobolus stellatus SS14]|uniref:Uncharacterized protein n=1 Tax=Sphaerobolus stellatus (strain SS14) TaxID=990650 RepID=A0A0C9UDL5_SPHS4|nr:hypothetical protein M422DRAFT_276242 [Sphaerobolus stellatus SS14]
MNLGFDNRDCRAANFWNIDFDAETAQAECHEAYKALKLNDDDLTDEGMEEIQKKREEIKAKFRSLEEKEELQYREGNTASLMRKAHKELTARAQWLAL